MTFKSAKLKLLQEQIKALENVIAKAGPTAIAETYKTQLAEVKLRLFKLARYGK